MSQIRSSPAIPNGTITTSSATSDSLSNDAPSSDAQASDSPPRNTPPNDSLSSALCRWLLHRCDVLGISSWESLAQQAGLSPATIEGLIARASLKGLGRSGRGWLARALKVSLRDLEKLADGRIFWIDDASRVDLDRPRGSAGRTESPTDRAAIPRAAEPGRGVPIVGRTLPGGGVEWIQPSSPESVRRLDVKFGGAPDAYALEDAGLEHAPSPAVTEPHHPPRQLVFVPESPINLKIGMLVVLTASDGTTAGLSLVGCLRASSGNEAEVEVGSPPTGQAEVSGKIIQLDLSTVVRASRLLAVCASVNSSAPEGVP